MAKEKWTTVAKVSGGKVIPDKETADSIITSEGATSVEIHYGPGRLKKVTIDLNHPRPKYTFEGLWAGKDINLIIRTIRRAYLQRAREIRREAIATFKNEGSELSKGDEK